MPQQTRVAAQGVNGLSFSNNPRHSRANVFVTGPKTLTIHQNRLDAYAKTNGKRRILVLQWPGISCGQLGRDAILSGDRAKWSHLMPVPSITPLAKTAGDRCHTLCKSCHLPTVQCDLPHERPRPARLPRLPKLLQKPRINGATTQIHRLTRLGLPRKHWALPGVQAGWFAMPDPGATSAFTQRYKRPTATRLARVAGLAFDGIAALGALANR